MVRWVHSGAWSCHASADFYRWAMKKMFWKKPKTQKHAAVHIHRNGGFAISVPLHYNGQGGFLYEGEPPEVINPLNSVEQLGDAIIQSVNASTIKQKNDYPGHKPSDWPGFTVSGCQTIRQFEKDFIRLHIHGANEYNIVFVIEGAPYKDSDISIVANSNPTPSSVGQKCLLVWKTCVERQF